MPQANAVDRIQDRIDGLLLEQDKLVVDAGGIGPLIEAGGEARRRLNAIDVEVGEARIELAEAKGRAERVRTDRTADGSPDALDFMGSGSSPVGSWATAILNDQARRGSGINAALLDPSGTVPVSVPLSPLAVTDPRRARFVRELMPNQPAENGHYSYFRQKARTNNAAAVERGALKPTSVYTLERIDDRTRTVAHLSEPIPRQDLEDAALLRQFVDEELRYGLYLAVDAQILSGSGSGENMTGFLDDGVTIQDLPGLGGVIETTRRAVTMLELVEVAPTYWVISPMDWEAIDLAAQFLFAGNSAVASPIDTLERRLHGVPVLVSTAIPEGTALLGDFAGSAKLHVTNEARVEWSENTFDPDFGEGGASDFQRNLVRFRAEGRWNLAITRPMSFVAVEIVTDS